MNKKLFKGALVLFASILMAVSCQSNSNPDGDGTTKPNGPGTPTKQDVAVSLKTGSKLGAAGTTDSKVEIAKSATTMEGTAKTVDVSLVGDDIANVAVDGEKIVVSVASVEGVPEADFTSNETVSGTKKTITATIANTTITPTIAAESGGKKLTLTFEDTFGDAVGGSSGQITAGNDMGVVKVMLKFEDKTEAKNTITIPVYVIVAKKA